MPQTPPKKAPPLPENSQPPPKKSRTSGPGRWRGGLPGGRAGGPKVGRHKRKYGRGGGGWTESRGNLSESPKTERRAGLREQGAPPRGVSLGTATKAPWSGPLLPTPKNSINSDYFLRGYRYLINFYWVGGDVFLSSNPRPLVR